MSRNKRRDTPEWQWEQALLDAYYDHRWHEVLDPLYEQFQHWTAGQRTHDEMDQAIHQAHTQAQKVYRLFGEKRAWLVQASQFDREWFEPWVADHPPPETEAHAGAEEQ